MWIVANDYNVLLLNCAISIDRYTSIYKFNRFLIFSLLIDAIILLLNCHFNTLSLHKFCLS